MNNDYFDITIKTRHLGERSYTFQFIDTPCNGVIAKDMCSNQIVIKSSGVFIYVHDADEGFNYVKLFNSLDEFYKGIETYDEVEFYNRLDSIYIEPDKDQDPDYVPDCSILISKFVKALGGKRLIDKYKEGSNYNVTQAYIDGTITADEFRMLQSIDIIK